MRQFLALLFFLAGTGRALAFETLPVTLDVTIDGDPHRLETLIVKPDGNGPFPLAILSHGSPRKAAARKNFSPYRYTPQAREFAAHGYLAAIVARRDYGRSSGGWAENYGGCSGAFYERAGFATADDIAAAVGELSKRQDVDATTIVAAGISAGGFGSLAYAARRPAGLKAVINFAGGRGSQGKNDVCRQGDLLDAFEAYGKTTKVPELWIYSENDYFFWPDLARGMLKRFTANGAKVTFVMAPPSGRDGHFYFASRTGMQAWRSDVQAFLKANGLPATDALPSLTIPKTSPPGGLDERGIAQWKRYLGSPDHKAFAMDKAGHIGWRTSQRTTEEAKQGALGNCKGECTVVSVNGAAAE